MSDDSPDPADSPHPTDPADFRYAGEDVVERISLDGARIAVTSHRVLVLTPDGPDRRFRSVYRPNVVEVAHDLRANTAMGRRALKAGVYGLVLLGAGFFLNLDSLVAGLNLSGTGGLGGAAALIGQMLFLFTLLDDLLLGAGALAAVAALVFAGVYLHGRDREFRIEVAGGDPISLPMSTQGDRIGDRLEAALDPESA